MPAGYSDQYIEQGTSFTTQLTLDDSYGAPFNLNGFTVKSQAKTSYYSSNAVLTFVASVFDANNGVIQLSADSANTSALPPGKLVYDVIIKDNSSNNITRVLEGQIFVSPAVTSM